MDQKLKKRVERLGERIPAKCPRCGQLDVRSLGDAELRKLIETRLAALAGPNNNAPKSNEEQRGG